MYILYVHFGTHILAWRVNTLNSLYTILLEIINNILYIKEVEYYQVVLLKMICTMYCKLHNYRKWRCYKECKCLGKTHFSEGT